MIQALIRPLRPRLRPDVRYDLLDDLIEALYVQGKIEMQKEREEEMKEFEEYVRVGGRTDLIESHCVGCGQTGVWRIHSSICPSCAADCC